MAEPVKVEQVDIDAAEPFRRGFGGKYDRDQQCLQVAFARHRLAERDRMQAEIDRLRELLAECADDIEAAVEGLRGKQLDRTTERDLDIVRRARAALAKPGKDDE